MKDVKNSMEILTIINMMDTYLYMIVEISYYLIILQKDLEKLLEEIR